MNFLAPIRVILFIIKDIFSENENGNVFCFDKTIFYVLFLERALLVDKTLNFNPSNAFCSSSALLHAISLN